MGSTLASLVQLVIDHPHPVRGEFREIKIIGIGQYRGTMNLGSPADYPVRNRLDAINRFYKREFRRGIWGIDRQHRVHG